MIAHPQTLLFFFVLALFASRETAGNDQEKAMSLREQAVKEQMERHQKNLDQLMKENQELKVGHKKDLAEIERKWAEVVKKKELEIQELKEKNESQESEKKKQFLSIYEKMEPKQAAKILEGLDRKLASEIFSEMKVQRGAEILGKMNAETAKEITEISLNKRHSRQVNKNTEDNPIAPIGSLNKEERR